VIGQFYKTVFIKTVLPVRVNVVIENGLKVSRNVCIIILNKLH